MSLFKKKGLWFAIVFIILVLGVMSLLAIKTKPKAHISTINSPIVSVKKLAYKVIPQTVTGYGEVVSTKSIKLMAQTDGKISNISFKYGQKVKKGQLLLRITSNDINNQVAKLKAQMINAKSLYERQLQQEKNLPNSIAKQTLLQTKTQYQQATASYKEALDISNIRAPINGTISDSSLNIGDFVTTGQVIAKIANSNAKQVKYQLGSKYFTDLKPGQSISFTPNATKTTYQGTVAYVSPQLSSTDYLVTIRANLKNSVQLPENSFGKVTQVTNPNHKVLALPQRLVQADTKGFFVYSVAHNKIISLYFQPGSISHDGFIAIKKGLKAGTEIITSNIAALSPGQTVKVKTK